MAYSPRLRAILNQSRQQISEGNKVGHERIWIELETTETPKRRRPAKQSQEEE
jgi:hypothetical protein